MFSVIIDVHKNILSAQCHVKFEGKDTSVNSIQITGSKNDLKISLLRDAALVYKFRLLTPENFFIPTSVSKTMEITKPTFNTTQNGHSFENSQTSEEVTTFSEQQDNDFACFSNWKMPVARLIHVPDSTYVSSIENKEFSTLEIGADSFKYFTEINPSNSSLSDGKRTIETNFRLQLTSSEVLPCSINEILPTSKLHGLFKKEILPNELYDVVCTTCDIIISRSPVLFQDVKEYCNNISELQESWFCHGHASFSLGASSDTLHVDNLCLLLHSTFLESFSLEMQDLEYKCTSCSTILTSGIVSDNHQHFRRFFADAIMLRKAGAGLCPGFKYSHMINMLSLWNIINNDQNSLPFGKLYFQSKAADEEVCLLLQILPVEVAQFKFQAAADSIPAETVFKTSGVYKVLYHVGTKSSKAVELWRRKFDVEFYKVSTLFIKTVIDHLKSSSEYIPGGQNVMDGFSHSCLPSRYEDMLDCYCH